MRPASVSWTRPKTTEPVAETPELALIAAYWIHMIATIVWGGTLSALAFLVYPLLGKVIPPDAYQNLLHKIHNRLDRLGWISISSFIVTGLVQMSANANYSGMLQIDSEWAVALLLKHVAFAGIVVICAIQTWSIAPTIEHALLAKSLGKQDFDSSKAERTRKNLVLLNLALTAIVLVFTAIARVA